MKKILSFVLVLAMVLSCVSMVTFASEEATTWEPAETDVTGVLITATNASEVGSVRFRTPNAGITENMLNDEGNLVLSFRVYNLTARLFTWWGTVKSGWTGLVQTYAAGNAYQDIPAGATKNTTKEFTMTLTPNENGKLVDSNGNEYSLNSLWIDFWNRTAINEGDQFVIQGLNEASIGFFNNIPTGDWYTAETITGDQENYARFWRGIDIAAKGEKIRVHTNRGIWTNDTTLATVTFYVYNPEKTPVTFKTMIGCAYTWNAADGEGKNKQHIVPGYSVVKITLTATLNEEGKVTSGTNTYTPSSCYAAFYEIDGHIIVQDSRYDATYITGTPSSDGKSAVTNLSTIPIFDKATGVKITFNQAQTSGNKYFVHSVKNNVNDVKADEIDEDGYIKRQYVVYNMSDHMITVALTMNATNNWNSIQGITYTGNPSNSSNVQISAYSYRVYNVQFPVNEEGTVTLDNGSTTALTNIWLRLTVSGEINANDTLYIESLNNTTNDSMHNLTNAAATVETVNTKFAWLCGAELTLGEQLTYSITTLLEKGSSADDVKVKVTRKSADDLDIIDELTTERVDWKGQAIFKYNLNAQCMGDDLTFELVYGNDTVATEESSIKQYAINMFGKTAEKLGITEDKFTQLKTLLSDMLVYGAAAQKYIGYKKDALVTDLVDAEDIALTPTTFDSSNITPVSNDGNNNKAIRSAGLNISHVNKIYFRLDDTVDMETAGISITAGGSDVVYTVKGNVIYTDAIMATGFDTVYTITVISGEDASVINYSVNTYIANKHTSGSVGDICKALYNYGQSAVAFAQAE